MQTAAHLCGGLRFCTHTFPPERTDPAVINILCPDTAFRTHPATICGGSLRSGDMPRQYSVSHPTERRPRATNRISAVGQVDVPLARFLFVQYGLLNQPSYRGRFCQYLRNYPRQLAFNAWVMLCLPFLSRIQDERRADWFAGMRFHSQKG